MSRTSISEVVNQDESPDDRFVSDEFRLPSLQTMAAYRVSLPIWYNHISSEKHNASVQKTRIISYYNLLTFDRHYKYVDPVKVHYQKYDELITTSFSNKPKFVREILTECLNEVHENVFSWMHWSINCFRHPDFTDYRMKDLDPNYCVWYANGKIDYRRSAVNILNSRGLNAEQRFALVSKYCMEDEIKTFSLNSLNPDFIKSVNFNNDHLMYYWICYLKNTLHEIPTGDFNSIDAAMAAKILDSDIINKIYWTAFQYFWNRLGIEDQILVTKLKLSSEWENFKTSGYHDIDEYNIYNVEERLFSMLPWYQQRSFIYPTLDESILIFCIRLDSPNLTFWTWNLCKDMLTIEQFANMVDLILRESVEYENVMKLFMHLWNTVPTHFRTQVLKVKENEMINKYFFHRRALSPTSVKFLCDFLSLKSPDFRKEFMLNNGFDICYFIKDPNCLTKLLNFCLPNQTHQEELKKLILNSNLFKEECADLFVFDETFFKSKTEYFALNRYDVIKLKKWILESDLLNIHMYRFLLCVDKWNKLSNLIDDIYPDNPSLALEKKKQIVLSFATNAAQYCLTASSPKVGKLTTITELLRFTESEKETLKQTCLNYFKEMLYRQSTPHQGHFYNRNLQIFMLWCLDDDKEAISNLKNSISLDTVFDNYFDGLIESYTTDSTLTVQRDLSQLNYFLKWYFTSAQEIKKFKISKINNYDIKILKILLEQNDEIVLEQLLKWFFENDETAIFEFQLRGSFENGNVEFCKG